MAATIYNPIATAFGSPSKSIAAVDFVETQPSALLQRNHIAFINRRVVGELSKCGFYDTTATCITRTLFKGK